MGLAGGCVCGGVGELHLIMQISMGFELIGGRGWHKDWFVSACQPEIAGDFPAGTTLETNLSLSEMSCQDACVCGGAYLKAMTAVEPTYWRARACNEQTVPATQGYCILKPFTNPGFNRNPVYEISSKGFDLILGIYETLYYEFLIENHAEN